MPNNGGSSYTWLHVWVTCCVQQGSFHTLSMKAGAGYPLGRLKHSISINSNVTVCTEIRFSKSNDPKKLRNGRKILRFCLPSRYAYSVLESNLFPVHHNQPIYTIIENLRCPLDQVDPLVLTEFLYVLRAFIFSKDFYDKQMCLQLIKQLDQLDPGGIEGFL